MQQIKPNQHPPEFKRGKAPISECGVCVGKKKDGSNCTRKACGTWPMCWQHMLSDSGLRVMKSTIAGAGKGLFVTRNIKKGENISYYSGDILTQDQFDSRYPKKNGSYVLEIKKGVNIDARSTATHPARYINHKVQAQSNTNFTKPGNGTWADQNNFGIVKATKNIQASKAHPAELFVNYGRQYWTGNTAKKTVERGLDRYAKKTMPKVYRAKKTISQPTREVIEVDSSPERPKSKPRARGLSPPKAGGSGLTDSQREETAGYHGTKNMLALGMFYASPESFAKVRPESAEHRDTIRLRELEKVGRGSVYTISDYHTHTTDRSYDKRRAVLGNFNSPRILSDIKETWRGVSFDEIYIDYWRFPPGFEMDVFKPQFFTAVIPKLFKEGFLKPNAKLYCFNRPRFVDMIKQTMGNKVSIRTINKDSNSLYEATAKAEREDLLPGGYTNKGEMRDLPANAPFVECTFKL